MIWASFIKNLYKKSCELVASIRETALAGNDTPLVSGYFFMSLFLMCGFVFCGELFSAQSIELQDMNFLTTEQKKEFCERYLKTADLLFVHAHASCEEAIRLLKGESKRVGSFFLGGLFLGFFQRKMHKKIDDLAASQLPEAHNVLNGLVEYYKAFFVLNILKAASAERFKSGENILSSLVFLQDFLVENSSDGDPCYFMDVQRKVDFIKFSMELISHARSAWWRRYFSKIMFQKRIEKSLSKFDSLFLPCFDSEYHDSSKCSRCSLLQMFHMVNLAIMHHKTWKDPLDSYVLEKVLVTIFGVGIATLFLSSSV